MVELEPGEGWLMVELEPGEGWLMVELEPGEGWLMVELEPRERWSKVEVKPEKGHLKIEKEPGERLRVVLDLGFMGYLKGLNLYQEKVKFFSLFIELQCREYLFEF